MAAAISAQTIVASGKPYLLYGTAWKKDDTAGYVTEAIRSGFRFIDTACQPKHYNEPGVGEGIVTAMKELNLSREDLYIQTKFTSLDGQDENRIPYDPDADLEAQVLESVDVSLHNLKTTYLDSLLMHSPMRSREDTLRVWRVFESLVDDGKVRHIGISNCYNLDVLIFLFDNARIKPSHVQNRFYSESEFDIELRGYCHDNNILYQSFWTLTINREALNTPEAKEMAAAKGLTPQTLMYAFMMTMGHTPLDGTTTKTHMMEDVAVMERMQSGEQILSSDEMETMTYLLGMKDSF
jgi:diketogulonate reductase-like aldo/keto reductase